MNLNKDYEIRCQQVWLEAWVRVASASNCTRSSAATSWADECLARFKDRFKPEAADGTKA